MIITHRLFEELVEKLQYKKALNLLKYAYKQNHLQYDTIIILIGRNTKFQNKIIQGGYPNNELELDRGHIVRSILLLSRELFVEHNEVVLEMNSDDERMSLEDQKSALAIKATEARVREVLKSNYPQMEWCTIKELTKITGAQRRYVAAVVEELKLCQLLQRKREQKRTRFLLTEEGMKLLNG